MDNERIEINKSLLNPKQEKIHKRLKEIGEEIASFYYEAIMILNNPNNKTKSNLIAHLAREIDGGLRDILASKSILDETMTIDGEDIKRIKKEINEDLESRGIKKIGTINKNVISICNALNIDVTSQLLKEWIICSVQFNRFAHRHGAFKDPRPFELFQDVWNRYEDVLFHLVGSYYKLLDRIDDILEKEEPSEEILLTLPNLFRVEARKIYFFSKLEKIKWLKPLRDADFFNPKDNPKRQQSSDPNGFVNPYWSPLGYVERISKTIPSDGEEIELILDIIKLIIDYRDEGTRIENFNTDYMIFKILCNLPSSRITKEHLDFVEITLFSEYNRSLISSEIGSIMIPKLIKDEQKELLLQMIDISTKFKVNTNVSFEKTSPLIEEFWFSKLIEENLEPISKYCPLETAELLIQRMKEILVSDEHAFNNVRVPTIEDHPQTNSRKRYETLLVRSLRILLENLPDTILREKTIELLKEENSIFKRVAFYFIGTKYDYMKELFWSLEENPLDLISCTHEVFELLKTNSLHFEDREINRIVEWIEAADYPIPERIKDDDEKIQEYLAIRKKEWFSALDQVDSEIVKEKNEYYDSISSTEIEHPGHMTWHESWMGNISPINETELSEKSLEEISKYLQEYKEEKGFKKPSAMGLSDTFTKIVSNDTKRFSQDLTHFKEVPNIYKYSLLHGLREAWNKGEEINWENTLSYIWNMLNNKLFWEEKDGEYNYIEWTLSEILRFIEDGTRNDEHAFDISLLNDTKKIVFTIAEVIKSDLIVEDDMVNSTLNTCKGKLLSSMFSLSLRISRTSKEPYWDPQIKSFFDNELKKNPSLELYTTLGEYLRNFMYLDKEWVVSNIDIIFNTKDKDLWYAAISGYLFPSTVYQDMYLLLSEKGIYDRALDQRLKEHQLRERLVSHICISFLEGWETIDSTTTNISKMVNHKHNYSSEIIHHFWVAREKIKKGQQMKVKQLWGHLFKNNKEKGEILRDLLRLLSLFDDLDDELYEWAIEGAKYIQDRFSSQFIESLLKFVEAFPKETGTLFLTMIENIDYLPRYDESHIVKIVKTLYEKHQKELANDICNKYGEGNIHFLRDIYNKNNTSIVDS